MYNFLPELKYANKQRRSLALYPKSEVMKPRKPEPMTVKEADAMAFNVAAAAAMRAMFG